MSCIQKIAKKTGVCLQCRQERTVYFLPEQAAKEANCLTCRLPLSSGEADVIEAWKTDPWTLLLIDYKVIPEDITLFRRREELLLSIPPWEQVSLGIAPVRVKYDLIILRRTAWHCRSCGVKKEKFCLTEFANRRLSCDACGKQVSQHKTNELHAGLTDDGVCCVIGNLTPLAPVIIGQPSGLSIMSADDLELVGIL